MVFADVARTIAFIEPWKVVSAGLAAIKRWRAARSFSVSGMSVEWLAEHERASAKSGGQL
jgi:hypothetical protein